MTDNTREFMFQAEVAHVLGVSPHTLKEWRKAGRGPKWRTASRQPGHGRPLYERACVAELRVAFEVLDRMGLRNANYAPLPEMTHSDNGGSHL